MVIILASTGIGYAREYSARAASQALQNRLRTLAAVMRDGKAQSLPLEEIVPGDVVLLSAGSIVPADAIIVEASDCFASESVLTGESFPVEKRPGVLPPETPLADRTNSVFLGSNIRSGTARCLVVGTGRRTQFGAIAHRLALRRPETQFDRGLRRFGYLLTTAMLWIVLAVFAIHVLRGRPPAETLLFAVALAVGLSPELLPFILSLNLARGAQLMAEHGVLVRRLNAIENLGGMNVLCTDKTGTLTEGVVRVEGAYGPAGEVSREVRRLAEINASLQTGLNNPLDAAILLDAQPDLAGCEKLGEIPFDFARKRLSVIVRDAGGPQLITKGAYPQVVADCSKTAAGLQLDSQARVALDRLFQAWSGRGIRVVGVATCQVEEKHAYSRDDECEMSFAGFLTFLTGRRGRCRSDHGSRSARRLSQVDHRRSPADR
ncbi:MAG: HAD-IC family P-type ATPase [Bryobacterales bacterium]